MKNLCLPFLFCFSTLCSQAQWLVQNTNFTNPHNCMMIDVVDANVAWTSGWTGNFATMGGWSVTTDDHTFSRTIDGQNWQQGIFDPDGNGLITGLSAVDANTAFIAYNDYGADNSAQVLKTTDGGLNWDSLHVGIFYWINFVHAFDANNIIAMGDPDAEGFQVYISSDGGTTWERIDPFLLAANSGEFGPVNTYSVDGDQIWFSTSKGRIFHSEDKGANWEFNGTPVQSGPNYPDCLACRDEGVCIQSFTKYTNNADTTSYHKAYLYRTFNNGYTWDSLELGNNQFCVAGMQYIPGSGGVLIASFRHNNFDGPFYTRISYDDGDNWITVDSTARVYHFDFIDPDHGYATEYENDSLPTDIYRFDGSPLLGLIKPGDLMAEISLSPNPAFDQVTFEMKADAVDNFWILLHDAQGNLLQKQSYSGVSEIRASFDIRHLPAGLYTVTVSNSNGSNTKKIVKL